MQQILIPANTHTGPNMRVLDATRTNAARKGALLQSACLYQALLCDLQDVIASLKDAL